MLLYIIKGRVRAQGLSGETYKRDSLSTAYDVGAPRHT